MGQEHDISTQLKESQLTPYVLLTSNIHLWDGDVSRDGAATVEDSLHGEVILPWAYGDL